MKQLNRIARKQNNYNDGDKNITLNDAELEQTETLFEKMYKLFIFSLILEEN